MNNTHSRKASSNGMIISLSSIEESSSKNKKSNPALIPHTLERIPHVFLLKVYNMSRELFYLPSDWTEYRNVFLALIRAAHQEDTYFRNSEIFISVLPAADIKNLKEGNHLMVTPKIMSPRKLNFNDIHDDHNFILSWFSPEEPEPVTGSLNLML